jgi:hypothetical protein
MMWQRERCAEGLVWGFSCQMVFPRSVAAVAARRVECSQLLELVVPVLCSERERPFFVPSPTVRLPQREEGVKGQKC